MGEQLKTYIAFKNEDGDKDMLADMIHLLKFNPLGCPRHRETLISATEPTVYICGRYGGGNREEYAKEIARFSAQPAFVEERDLEFDETYGQFTFQVSWDPWIWFWSNMNPELSAKSSWMRRFGKRRERIVVSNG